MADATKAALAFVHDAGKLHRDVKPSNVMVRRDGRVVVLDFGLSTALRGSASSDGGFSGTLPYAAPEQIWGGPRHTAADWYAVGTLLYEALSGRLVSRVYEPGELLPAAYELAQEIVANTSAVSVAAIRRLMWSGLSAASPWEAHAADSRLMVALGGSPDAAEGVTSFLEKRPAEFPMSVSADLPGEVPLWPSRPEGM